MKTASLVVETMNDQKLFDVAIIGGGKEIGIDVDKYNASQISNFNLFSKYSRASMKLEQEARGLSRYVLDELILDRAKEAGVVIKRGIHVNNYQDLAAKELIIATGKHDTPEHQRKGENIFIAYKMHYRVKGESKKLLEQAINIFLYDGGYAGLCLVENGIANLCFIIDKKIYKRKCQNYTGLIAYIKKQNKFLDTYLNNAMPLWDKPLTISNIPYGFIDRDGNRNTIGDQYAVTPSLMGNGMAIAYITAKQAAMDYHSRRILEQEGIEITNNKPVDIEKKIRLACFVHKILKSSVLASFVTLILVLSPSLMRYIFRQTRML
jgi:flavin-dependent dehydrogenase